MASRRIVISSGFVSYSSPYFYTANSRVKVFTVEDLQNQESYDVELADTPCPQYIKLQKLSDHIKLVIKEVYPGEKWEDTAVNFLCRF